MPINLDALRWYDARAVKAGVAVVDRVTADDLDKPTPCTGWSLADLLAHMTAQHRGFAAAARGQGADLRNWAIRPLEEPDPAEAFGLTQAAAGTASVPMTPAAAAAAGIRDYRAAAAEVFAAFGEVTDREQDFMLPEITPAMPFPAWQAIGFHFIDYVVHAWDVARTLGLPFTAEADIAEAALPIALAVPTGPSRHHPGAAFAPPVPGPGGQTAAPFTRILRTLGRSPSWTPPRSHPADIRQQA